MQRFNRLRAVWVMMLALVAAPLNVRAASVDVTKVGTPVWDVVDCNLVSANVGTAASGYAEFFKLTGEQILPPPFYKNYPGVGAGPGDPHAPPYDKDISNGLAALGLTDRSSFDVSDFSSG